MDERTKRSVESRLIKRIDNFSKSTQFSNLKSVRVDKWPKIADVRTERADLISKTADLNPED